MQTTRVQRIWTAFIAAIFLILPVQKGSSAEHVLEPAVLELTINSAVAPSSVVTFRGERNELWLNERDFEPLRLRIPHTPARILDGERYFRLNDIAQSVVQIDDAQQRALINVPAAAFVATSLSMPERKSPALTTSAWGSFLNYELTTEHNDSAVTGGAFTELGIFGPHGVVTNTAVATANDNASHGVRLETTWTHDFPDALQTLRVGDAISAPGSWGSAVRFGGVQWGTNFALRPDLITAPLLTAGGLAIVPSTVDVFLNNQQVSTQQVPSGPFVIDRLPAITGAGDVRVVVRDALGREQVVTVPFYSGTTLLRAGLSQYSFAVGQVRENFALESWTYHSLLTSATYRRGLNDIITLEGHGELLRNGSQDAGLNAAIRVGRLGVLGLTAARGGDSEGSGWLYGLSFERAAQRVSFVLSTQCTSEAFKQVSTTALDASKATHRSFGQIGLNLTRAGTLTLAGAIESFREQPHRSVMSLTHSISVGEIGFLSLAVSHTRTDRDATNAYLTFTVPLSGHRSASIVARYDEQLADKTEEIAATLQQSPPPGTGLGYRIAASTAGNYDADVLMQFAATAIDVEAARYADVSAQRGTVFGAATLLDGQLRASRSVTDSFASIDVGGIPNVVVFVENQPVTRTDASGRALLRNLRPYEENRVSIEPTELPLDTVIDARVISITPAYRSGAKVRFPVSRERGATFTLLLPSGSPVPAGATVHFKNKLFTVATDGMTYITGFDHGMSGTASWPHGRCLFRLEPHSADDPLPDLGQVICHTTESPVQARVGR